MTAPEDDVEDLFQNAPCGYLCLRPDGMIARVNDSFFGLQTGVFTADLGAAWKSFSELEVGGVIVNDIPTYRIDNMPYGGVKDSGLGREGIRWAIEDMTEIRIMVLAWPQ